ncbi:GEVED domain-containing protein, partial [Salinimicrobium sp. CAU 1759]
MESLYISFRYVLSRVFLLSAVLIFTIGANAQQKININEPGSIPATEISPDDKNIKTFLREAKRARQFKLNPAILNRSFSKGAEIQLELFSDRNFPAIVKDVTTRGDGTISLSLKLKEYDLSNGFMILSNNAYLLNINIPELNESYSIRKNRDSSTGYLIQLDETETNFFECGTTTEGVKGEMPVNKDPVSSTQKISVDPVTCEVLFPTEQELATIKLLVLYTDAAEIFATDNSTDINTLISGAILQANDAVGNNNLGISFTFEAVKLNYTEQGFGTDYVNLLTNNLQTDDAFALRKTHQGDLVILLSSYDVSTPGGIATPMRSRFGAPTKAFANVRAWYALNTDAFIHEIGHLLGLGHYKYQNSDPGPTNWLDWSANTWSGGWRFEADDPAINGNETEMYGTIMTYKSGSEYVDGRSTRSLLQFSDPTVPIFGVDAGSATEGDGARTILATKHYVARYEETADYCLVTPPDNYPNEYYLSNVNMGLISNSSVGMGYADYTTLATCMLPGETQQLSVDITRTQNWATYFSVWIDWNDDKQFDLEELFFTSETSSLSFSTEITAPTGLPAGPKRIRLRTHPNGIIDPCGGSDFGEIEDYTIDLGEGDPCNSLSIPQNLVVTENNGTDVTISWDPLSGVDYYELQYREAGGANWTTISNIIYPSQQITGLSITTNYEVQARSFCSGSPTAYSDILPFTTETYTYCDSGGNTSDSYISRVQLNTIDNTSTNENGGYSDFTDVSTGLEQNTSYTLTITPGWTGTNFSIGYGVWIDYNYDGDFDDPEEEVFLPSGITSATSFNVNFTVPYGVQPGPTRLRIVARQGNIPSACGLYSAGETEDYTVILAEGPECVAATIPTGLSFEDTLLSWDLVPGATYDVRYRESGASTWIDINDIVYNYVNLPNLIFDQEYEAQVRSKCEGGATSSYSSSFTFVVGYCSSSGTDANISITRVRVGTIDNVSSGDVSGYTDFTSIVSDLKQTNSYSIIIDNSGPLISKVYRAWIDLNHDGDFEDTGELVMDVASATNTASGNFTVPDNTVLGLTTMRISMKMYSGASSCEEFLYGEVEDYTVNIIGSCETSTTWYADDDEDDYGVDDIATNIEACENPGAGYASQAGDCNDNDPAINPGATEVCDGVDNNCDGNIDEGLTTSTWYADSDGDLYGIDDPATNIEACENPGAGYASQAGDCNDNDPAINPGATEVCDGVDNNCDGNIDEGLTTSTWYADADGDDYGVDDPATNIEACENPGAGYASQAGDCND